MKDVSEFGKWLKAEMKKRKLSQWDLADMLYVDQSVVSKWTCGARIPKLADILRILDALELRMEFVENDEPLKEQPHIVRCRDCKKLEICCIRREDNPDWFCAEGERKDALSEE